MTKYQGHKNWNSWNVSLWINNDEGLYRLALDILNWCKAEGYTRQAAAIEMLRDLQVSGITHTPDGAPYSVTTIRAAMRGMQP